MKFQLRLTVSFESRNFNKFEFIMRIKRNKAFFYIIVAERTENIYSAKQIYTRLHNFSVAKTCNYA